MLNKKYEVKTIAGAILTDDLQVAHLQAIQLVRMERTTIAYIVDRITGEILFTYEKEA